MVQPLTEQEKDAEFALRVIKALQDVCKRWRSEYHCCPSMAMRSRTANKHSDDCPYVKACNLVGLTP